MTLGYAVRLPRPGNGPFGSPACLRCLSLDLVHRYPKLITALYYGVLGLLLLLAITGRIGDVLPGWVGEHVGKDSEALLVAVGLPAWIQFARPRLAGTSLEWPLTGLAVVILAALGGWMYATGPIPGNVETLNEPLFALAVLVAYVQLRRPVPRLLAIGMPAAFLLLILVASGTALVTNLAEGLAVLVLVPIGLDLVDRAILDPQRSTSAVQRWAWYGFLLLTPMVISTVLADTFTGAGAAGEAVRYAVRVQEAWLALLLVELYFAVGHGRVGPRRSGPPGLDTPDRHPSETAGRAT